MLPISARSVAIQSTLAEYRFGTLDKVVAVVEVVRFVAITGATVDALADAIVEAAEAVAFVGFVGVVDFDRSLVDSRRLPDCYPYPLVQTGHYSPFADYLDLHYFPKSLGVTVGVAVVD